MVDNRNNDDREISILLRETYEIKLKVLNSAIPHSVRAAVAAYYGKSIFAHDPKGKVKDDYRNMDKVVMKLKAQRQKSKSNPPTMRSFRVKKPGSSHSGKGRQHSTD